ncbi:MULTISPECIES: PP0621 family protein [unclassified Undibacterium]|uniref:PP0621 family protein n=1 Tax=unclassified Undibacterium TaxID=2630295 RepID=UPI003C2CFC6F
MKLLMWLVLAVLVILAIRKKARPLMQDSIRSRDAETTSGAAFDRSATSAQATETMVCCAHCQIYLPASEAVIRGQQIYCSSAHADLH